MSAGSTPTGLNAGRPGRRASTWRLQDGTRFHRLIWTGIAITSIGFIVSAAWIAFQSRSRTISAATASVENVALLLEKMMARKIEGIDALLHTALHEGVKIKEPSGTLHVTSLLAQLTRDLPDVKTIKLTNAANGATLFNLRDTGEAGDGIDLEIDRAYRDIPKPDLYVSRPRRDGPSRTWLTGISRPGEPGTPAATLVATAHLDIEQLQRLFEEISVGQKGTISLWRSDGLLIARKPYESFNVGRHLPSAALYTHLARSPVGTFETVSAADGLERIVAYRALSETSLILGATVSKEEILAPWRNDLVRDISLISTAILILIAFGVLMTGAARRRADAEAKAQHKSDVLEATLENTMY